MKQLFVGLLLLLCVIVQAQHQPPSPEQIRSTIAKLITDLGVPPEPVAKVENHFVTNGSDSIPIRMYEPVSGKRLPILYYVHGGGWVAGDLDTHDNICRYLANHLQAIVIAVHYRRPPEYKFPAAFDDSYTVLKWIDTHTNKLNGNGNLIVIGDSAGGQLVASLCLVNAKEKKPVPILAQVLINPGVNFSKGSVAYTTPPRFIDFYLNENDNTNDIRISPRLAENVRGVPPAIIVVGEHDKIRNDGEFYHQKLLNDGVKSLLYIQPNAGHLREHWCAADQIAKPAINFVVENLQQWLLK
ncbi:alpha/beta hydrolase [Rhodocytophaga rosea]|uniref:Alpha/beta hydrolase n=1 Tax=Rhodocytophaga rosea TaxID=2704465 RepID=A0A6C0GUL1_9BACT|nr:alpha/beta hydrolase [Rhodocytophaga rosea]QHT71494.1 alpha/beta hydrolase [Rhodocytophaga rosea]